METAIEIAMEMSHVGPGILPELIPYEVAFL